MKENPENKNLQPQPNGAEAGGNAVETPAGTEKPGAGKGKGQKPPKGSKPGGQGSIPPQEESGGTQTGEIARYSAMFGANYALKDAWDNLRDGMKINLAGQTTVTDWDISTINGNVNFIVTDFIPTVGYATKPGDPINVWSNQIMSALKSRMNKVTGINYDVSDILAFTIAGDSLAMWFTYICNIIQLSNTYTQKNIAFPEGILRALGIDPYDIKYRKTMWKSWVNDMSLKLQALYIPRQDVWNQRHQGLVSRIFTDDPKGSINPRGNFVIFRPTGFWAYDPAKKPSTKQDGFDAVEYKTAPYMGDKLLKIEDVVDFTNMLLQPLWGDQTTIDMSGDLQRLFPIDATLALTVPDLAATVQVGYSLDILLALHNANLYPGTIPYIKEVVPDPKKGSPYLKCVATNYSNSEQFSMTYQLIDANAEPGVDPTDEQKLNAVRWKYNVGSADYVPENNTKSAMGLKDFTSEILVGITLYNNNMGSDPGVIGKFEMKSHIRTITSQYNSTTKSYFVADDVTQFLYNLLPIVSFDTMPILYVVTSEKLDTSSKWDRNMIVFGNQYNAVEIDSQIIHNLNYALNLMMFPFNATNPIK